MESNIVAKALQARGDLRAKRGCNDDAVADYSALLNLAHSAPPGVVDYGRVQLARGNALCSMGSYAAAQADFTAVIDNESNRDETLVWLAHTALGNVYQLQGDFVNATESFAKAVRVHQP